MTKMIWETLILGFVCLVFYFLLSFFFATDDTDRGKWTRSGMSLYTDYGTGCQYLGKIFGGITPRVDKDGKHICK